jgi:dTMP kinase
MEPARLSDVDPSLFSIDHQRQWNEAGLNLTAPEHPQIWQITVDRPHVSNALHIEAMQSFKAITEVCKHHPPFAVIIYGQGGRFISGGDLKALHQSGSSEQNHTQLHTMIESMHEALQTLENLPSLIIAAIEGFAIGGGAELALSADLRIGGHSSYFKFPQRSLGLTTGWGGGRRLAQCVGSSRALSLLLSTRRIPAQEAYSLGLFHRLVEDGTTLSEAHQWAKECLQTSDASWSIKAMYLSVQKEEFNSCVDIEKTDFPTLWLSNTHWQQVDRFWKKKTSTPSTQKALPQFQFDFSSSESKSDTSILPKDPLSLKQGVHLSWAENQRPHAQHHLILHPSASLASTPGRFIVIEGGDGAGTTTQAQMMNEWLHREGYLAHLTREPSDGIVGKLVRKALADQTLGHLGRPLPNESIALLFAADRADHWANEIQPLLNEGVNVICDRYLYSSLAYQGLEHPIEWIRALNAPFPAPDLLLYIDVSPEVSAQRRHHRGLEEDRYETNDFQKQLADVYQAICQQASARLIDGNQRIDLVFDQCLTHLKSIFTLPSPSSDKV